MALAEEMKRVNGADPKDTGDSGLELNLVSLFYRLLGKAKPIILTAAACGLLMLLLSLFVIPPRYEATSKLYLVNSNAVVDLSALQASSSVSPDYKEVFLNHTVHDRAKQEMGLDYTYEELGEMISLSTPPDTHILCITVTSGDVQEAVMMANGYASIAQQFIKERMDSRMPTIFEEAFVPEKPEPVSPRKLMNTFVGVLLGGLLACAVVTVRFLMDDRISSIESVEDKTGINVLGVMPRESTPEEKAQGAAKNAQKAGEKEG